MKVGLQRQTTRPGYPTRRQIPEGLLAGVAAVVGLAAAAIGQEGRLRGEVAADPGTAKPAIVEPKPVIMGKMRADPVASTNSVAPSAAATNPPTCSVSSDLPRVLGAPPVRPAKGDRP